MRIRMSQTRRGWEDGFTCRQYMKGEIYDVAHTLACQFLNSGWATHAGSEDQEAEPKAEQEPLTDQPVT